MNRRLLVFIYPSYFRNWQLLNPYHEYRAIDRPHYEEERQVLVDIARERSWNDMDFMATIECESNRQRDKQSQFRTVDWQQEESYGLCQRNTKRHSWIVNDPSFSNRYWQLDWCIHYYNQRIEFDKIERTLYWYNVRDNCRRNFTIKGTYTLQDLKKGYLFEIK